MPDCKVCSYATLCIYCYQSKAVIGGCTQVAGCIAIDTNLLSPPLTNNCLICDDTYFYFDYSTKTCLCRIGWVVGDYCTTVFGCIVVKPNVTGLNCQVCNVTANFLLNPIDGSCQCNTGY